MATIFFSYDHRDASIVNKVRRRIERAGHEVLFDKCIPDGMLFLIEIGNAIETCEYSLIFVSRNSAESEWVNRETSACLQKDFDQKTMTTIPVKIDDVPLEAMNPFLRNLQVCDLARNFDEGLRELANRLKSGRRRAYSISDDDNARLMHAIEVAVRAGQKAMMYYNSSLHRNLPLDRRKNATTQADRAAEREAIPLIKQRFRDSIVSEEADRLGSADIPTRGYTWIVDPLDGTLNFMNQIDLFCTAIGVLKEAEPWIGVVFDPVTNQLYYGMNGLRSKVWKVASGEINEIQTSAGVRGLRECIVGTHVSSRVRAAKRMFQDDFLLAMSKQCRHIRMLGCDQMSLTYVASGRLQAFCQFHSHIWDQLAGVVIVRNAGGVVYEFDKTRGRLKEWTCKTRNVLACANESVAAEFETRLL